MYAGAEGTILYNPAHDVKVKSDRQSESNAAALRLVDNHIDGWVVRRDAPAETPCGTTASGEGSITLIEPPIRGAVRRTTLSLTLFD